VGSQPGILASLAVSAAIAAIPGFAQVQPLPLHRWDPPAGQFAGRPAKGVVITIHGGGWVTTGRAVLAQQPTEPYRRAGWTTLNVDYRAGRDSYLDVLRFYDLARSTVGPGVPICAAGQSAGGHLAMMLAVYRPRLACVISEAGPATLPPLRDGQTTPNLLGVLRTRFSASDAVILSPAGRLRSYRGRILASYSLADPIIPGAPQAAALRAAARMSHARIEVRLLPGAAPTVPPPPSMVPWVHSDVDQRHCRRGTPNRSRFSVRSPPRARASIRAGAKNDESPASGAFFSTATGIRTPVSAVRGRRPSPLDDGGAGVPA
jgi:acetyl esterase/lipase